MNPETQRDYSGPSAKRIKQNDGHGAVAVNVDQQLPDIFKLNLDCFEELFEYFSLQDLVAIAHTCKRMRRIAGRSFQLNYGTKSVKLLGRDIDHSKFYLKGVNVNCFMDFFQCIFINRANLRFLSQLRHSKSIKKIYIDTGAFIPYCSEKLRDALKDIVSKAESVTICNNSKSDLIYALVTACSNVKFLSLRGTQKHYHLEWMQLTFPKLEHIELCNCVASSELKPFLERNTTIKQLSIDIKLFWENRALFKNLKFDTLAILNDQPDYSASTFCHYLQNMHEAGTYKTLHFYAYDDFANKKVMDGLANGKGFSKLVNRAKRISLSSLINLEELSIKNTHDITDLQSLPHRLSKLKIIEFGYYTNVADILLFIRYAKQLEKIRLQHFRKELDLILLNKEREKLGGAQKITIFVHEYGYLETKWAMKTTDFSLIEMKRDTSYEWRQQFFEKSDF